MSFFWSQSVDVVIDLGDRIEDDNVEADLAITALIREQLLSYPLPVFHLHGNHDVVYAPKEQLNTVLGKTEGYEAVRLKDLNIILLDSTDPRPTLISHKQADWLKEQLKTHRGPTVVFCHHPLFLVDLSQHPYFAHRQEEATIHDLDDIRSTLLAAPSIKGIFQGHLHMLIKGAIQNFALHIVPSLTNSVDTKFPGGGFGILMIGDGGVQARYYGITKGKGRFDFELIVS